MEEVGKLWLEQEGLSSQAFSVGCEDLITFMSTQVKAAGPRGAPHPRLGPGPVCLWYVVHVARPQRKGPAASDNRSAAHSRPNQMKVSSHLLRNVGGDDPLNNRIVIGRLSHFIVPDSNGPILASRFGLFEGQPATCRWFTPRRRGTTSRTKTLNNNTQFANGIRNINIFHFVSPSIKTNRPLVA